jgi:hypothetical protein
MSGSQGDRIVPLPYATQTSRWQAWGGANASSRGVATRRVRESRRGMRAPRHPAVAVRTGRFNQDHRAVASCRTVATYTPPTQRLAVGASDDRSVGRPRHRLRAVLSSVIPTGWTASYVSPTRMRSLASTNRRALTRHATRLRRDQASSSHAIRAGSYADFPLASKAKSNYVQISVIRVFGPPIAGRLPVTPAAWISMP